MSRFSYGVEFSLELICTCEFFEKLKLHVPLRILINNINMKKIRAVEVLKDLS